MLPRWSRASRLFARMPPAEAGVFGPSSQIWRIDREAAVFLGAGRALLMQLAHPWVATAIAQHSTALGDPIGRFQRTFQIVFTLVFGSLDQALSVSRRLHLRHAAIFGSVPEPIGPYPAGSRYRANDVCCGQAPRRGIRRCCRRRVWALGRRVLRFP